MSVALKNLDGKVLDRTELAIQTERKQRMTPIITEERTMTPTEAINRLNEYVTVEMLVQRTKCCTGSRQVFLDSEANHRDPNNLGVVVTESGRAKFGEAGIPDPTVHFKGKTIRVHGVVIRKEKGPYIEVSEPSQIELVGGS